MGWSMVLDQGPPESRSFLGGQRLPKYRISRNSGRGSYPFVRQILPQYWVSAVLILGEVTINLV